MEQTLVNSSCRQRCTLKTCFMICASMQLAFMFTFGPTLFDNNLQEHYISGTPGENDTANATTAPSRTTTAPPQPAPTIPVYSGDEKKEANQFIEWYEKTCKEKRGQTEKQGQKANGLPLCPCVPPGLKGRVPIKTTVSTWETIAEANAVVRPGGEWSPADCRNTEKVAIVVPYRDREQHLRIFINHMHPILRRQRISYRIFVVEQAFPEVFNKACMMNIGFLEAMKSGSYDCVIFHDVDMMLEDDRHMYRCSDDIRHMGANVNKFRYRLAYRGLIGGATAFRKKHFERVNGFTNKFFGWGGEDDDMWQRIRAQKLKVIRFPPAVSRYTMIKHGRDSTNHWNPYSHLGWQSRAEEYKKDGVMSLKYRIHESQLKPLYTWIYAEPITALEQFNSYWGRSDDGTYSIMKLCLVDCAQACAAQSACKAFMTHKSMCKLKSTAFLQTHCKRFECDLIYVKKKYTKLMPVGSELQKFVEVSGSCNNTVSESVRQPLNFEKCASACNNSTKCRAFVHTTSPDACLTSPCDYLQPTNSSSSVYIKIPPNVMTHYKSRDGDCMGGDIEGASLSLEQCATKCRLTAQCKGFAFVNNTSSRPCWLKKQTCDKTETSHGVTMYDRT